MNDEAVRDEIAGVLHAAGRPDWTALTDLILPVVREIAAEEAGQALRDVWPAVWAVLDTHGHGRSAMALAASETVHDRADALTKPPDGPVR